MNRLLKTLISVAVAAASSLSAFAVDAQFSNVTIKNATLTGTVRANAITNLEEFLDDIGLSASSSPTFDIVTAESFLGVGTGLTALNGSNITSGTVAAARLGSGTADSTKFLRGDNTWQDIALGGSGDVTLAGPNAFTGATNSFGSLNLDATASTLYGPDGLGLYASGGITYISGGGGALLDLTSSAFSGAWSADQWSVINSVSTTPPKFTLDQGQTAKGRFTLNRTSGDVGWQGLSVTINRDYAADHTPSYDTSAQAATALTLEHSYTDRGGAGTFDTGTDVFTLATGTPPANYSAVLVTATTTMPTVGGVPLVAGTPYYVLAATGGAGGNFKIASSRALAIAGTALNIDGAGSGVSVSYDLQEVNLTYANSYSGEQRMFNIVAPSAAPKDGTIGMYAPFEVAIPSDHTGLALNGRVGVFSGYQNADQVKFVLSNLHATAGGTRLTMSSRSQDWHLDTDIGNNGGNNLGIYGAGGWRFYISSGGDIGIGNTAPSTKLDVTGTVTATLFSGSGASLTSVNAATVTLASDSTDASSYVNFALAATGSNALKTSSLLRFNPVSGLLTADAFAGALNGPVGITTPNTGSFTTVTTSGNIELGHATQNTLSASGGVLSIEGKAVLDQTNTLTGITNKTFVAPVLGAATATSLDAPTLLSSGTNIISQKNGSAAQELDIYNNATEHLKLQWSANTACIVTSAARNIAIALNGFSSGSWWFTTTSNTIGFGNVTSAAAGLKYSGTTLTTCLADGTSGGAFVASGTLAVTGDVAFGKTITAAGTTGAQTINKTSGAVNFAAAATSLVVTNSLVTTNSVVQCTVGSNDTTMKSVAVVVASGSFTIYASAAATAETRVFFTVTN